MLSREGRRHLGSTLLLHRSVCAESGGVGAHVTILRQGGSAVALAVYGGGGPAIYRLGPVEPSANSCSEVSGLFAGGDKSMPANGAAAVLGEAGLSKSDDERETGPTRYDHPGH